MQGAGISSAGHEGRQKTGSLGSGAVPTPPPPAPVPSPWGHSPGVHHPSGMSNGGADETDAPSDLGFRGSVFLRTLVFEEQGVCGCRVIY